MNKKKILLVEDDGLMIRLYRRLFTNNGYEVELAENGEVGYEKVKTFKPDLIFLDVMMPKMNGFELLAKLKSDPETKDFPVVMLTNLANKIDVKETLQKGAAGYLVKSDQDPEDVVKFTKKFLGE